MCPSTPVGMESWIQTAISFLSVGRQHNCICSHRGDFFYVSYGYELSHSLILNSYLGYFLTFSLYLKFVHRIQVPWRWEWPAFCTEVWCRWWKASKDALQCYYTFLKRYTTVSMSVLSTHWLPNFHLLLFMYQSSWSYYNCEQNTTLRKEIIIHYSEVWIFHRNIRYLAQLHEY